MFGKNFWKVPCMRNSLLYGISGGIGVGLLSFLLTSKAKQATKHMFGGYFAISIGFYLYCRTKLLFEMNNIREMQYAMQAASVAEGTERGPAINNYDKILEDV